MLGRIGKRGLAHIYIFALYDGSSLIMTGGDFCYIYRRSLKLVLYLVKAYSKLFLEAIGPRAPPLTILSHTPSEGQMLSETPSTMTETPRTTRSACGFRIEVTASTEQEA